MSHWTSKKNSCMSWLCQTVHLVFFPYTVFFRMHAMLYMLGNCSFSLHITGQLSMLRIFAVWHHYICYKFTVIQYFICTLKIRSLEWQCFAVCSLGWIYGLKDVLSIYSFSAGCVPCCTRLATVLLVCTLLVSFQSNELN